MKSAWSEREAAEFVERYAADGIGEDLALRVYTTRLLGSEPRLVMHGGGNTSVKGRARDVTGTDLDVLYVKGSGWDMGTIEPPGLPAVQLDPLLGLAEIDALSDEDMVNLQRRNLLDSKAPNPSVETLLHAWVPRTFIDHTHANAALVLTDQPHGEEICREVYGDRAAIVPYIMPGFDLAKAAKAAADAHPEAEGLVLLKHGLFTFGDTAQEAYELMIEWVSLAEARIERGRGSVFAAAAMPGAVASASEIAPAIRGMLTNRQRGEAHEGETAAFERFILEHRTSPAILAYVGGSELSRYSQVGTVTPDHAIRTKPLPVVLPAPPAGDLAAWTREARAAVEAYRTAYTAYFERHNPRYDGTKRMLDPSPRVVLVPGVGLFASGRDAGGAAAAADLAETTVDVITDAESMDRFESITEAELFDIEYWSLEQAKLAGAKEKALARHVVVVTGGAGAIGRATAAGFRAAGAEVALFDLPGPALDAAGEAGAGLAVPCDVTDDASVDRAFGIVAARFGGVDILVSNAGAAWRGPIADVTDDVLRESFELNFFAHQRVTRAAVRTMRAQGTGGCLLFNVSKQAVNPGPDFGPYGLPKAATLGLVRQYAIEHGWEGIRSNGVNADRIRSGVLTDEMIAARSEARGVTEDAYMRGNLLGREVRAEDVAGAFVSLALARATTGAILTVDGGNVAAALR
ncbi:MAG: bifunctional aldolase/short-chain dehydrogenase [Gemmatimonadota bacterium]|uniref:bifunctional aldolase/short-chain dehydrogenase n=1 Tax=Candidatus Palauibacter scopulicola TaxID=3056741 RepID=UPI0023A17D3F|nr:bifunctional aldolase/short-chain dehydrogenase [Candidatus Palauibacter scopulicola]MDE2664151.1 bifunctional aldolase/short-chain dehydrogenase [Candidatus Palauibacter scopulicola]